MTEETGKELQDGSVYYRRIVRSETGAVVSDERIKRDPVFAFIPPTLATIDGMTGVADITVTLALHDFDGERRADVGALVFKLIDTAEAQDEGLVFTREMVNGTVTLTLEIAAAGEYVITLEPPFPFDVQLSQSIRVKVI